MLGCLTFTSCSNRRIDMIEDVFGVALPKNYDVLKNTTESIGFAGADFQVNVELQFQQKEFKDFKEELLKIDSLKVEGENIYVKNLKSETASIRMDEGKRLLKFQFNHL